MNNATEKFSLKFSPKFSLPLAFLFALGMVGCGTSGPDHASGPGTGPVVPTPAADALPQPKAQYTFFSPKTELELRDAYREGDNQGRPIANYGHMIAKTVPGFNPAAFAKHGVQVRGGFSAGGANYYYLHRDSDLVETMKKVGNMGGLLYVEPEIISYTTAGLVYDNPDPYVENHYQYGALTTMARKAWETYGFGPNRPVVADIDTGVEYNHVDMTNVVRHAFSWYEEDGATPIPGGSPGADPEPVDWRVEQPDATTDGHGHGTHTAGTMAAQGNNGVGVAGMCWNVDLVSYKGMNDYGQGGSWAIYGSLWHLAKWKKTNYPHTIPVNMSLGSGYASQFGVDMVEMALEHDIVICAASGNDYSGFPSFPSSYTGAIRIGAVNHLDRRVSFSNWGNDMSVMAPGYYVLSVAAGDDYAFSDGTSMAAPHVTGLVGYMLTFAPDLKPDQIKTYLERNADPIEDQKGFDPRVGHGRINAYRTIGAVLADMNGAGAPASDYVLAPVKVTVKNSNNGAPLNGATVYLYNCSQSGTIANYAALALTGTSYVGVRDDDENAPEDGVAWFNMLKPGYYKVTASYTVRDLVTEDYSHAVAESQVFEVRRGSAVPPVTLALDVRSLIFVQTYPTSNPDRQGADTRVDIWSSGGQLLEYDIDYYDTVSLGLSAPGTYWIRIYPFQTRYGEYALWLGTSLKPSPAPGTFANAGVAGTPGEDGMKGGLTTTRSPDSQLIAMDDKVVYGDLTAANRVSGDWYRFVVE